MRTKIDVRHHSSFGLWIIDNEKLSVWRSDTERTGWERPKAVNDLTGDLAIPVGAISLSQIGTVEIGGYGEVDHRATSSSYYVFIVVGGVTHIIGRFPTQPMARHVRNTLADGVSKRAPSGTRASPSREGVPD